MKGLKNISGLLLSGMIICIAGFSAPAVSGPAVDKDDKVLKTKNEGPLYTAYNIWYETGKENALWCINYKTGEFIPAGTEVKDIRIVPAETGRFLGGSDQAISFVTVAGGQKYMVNFNEKFHPDKNIYDYLDMLFTNKDFKQLTEDMTDKEIEGIKKGVIKIGMSKKAALVSYGYPPEHKTNNLDKDVWLYWMNRFQSKAIHFDENNRAYRPEIDSDEL